MNAREQAEVLRREMIENRVQQVELLAKLGRLQGQQLDLLKALERRLRRPSGK